MDILTITFIDSFGEPGLFFFPATVSFVGLEVLVSSRRLLVGVPIILCCVVILGLLMPVDHQAKETVT